MKTIVPIVLAFLFFCTIKASAQPCTISHPDLRITNVNPATCQVTFDLSFTGDFNRGSKHAVIHLWEDPAGGYPASITYPASASATSQARATLVIKNPGDDPIYETGYPSSLGTLTSPYLVPTTFSWNGANSSRTFTLKGLVVTLSDCASVKNLKGDIYATQNDNNTNGGCINRGAFNFAANEPAMRGLMMCTNPARAFTVSFNTLSATSIMFKAYKDVAPFGLFDANDMQEQLTIIDGGGPSLTKTVYNPAQNMNQFAAYGAYHFLPQPDGSKFSVWIEAYAGNNTHANILLIQNSCAILPVGLTSFSAVREKQNVVLKWQTVTEQNNSGFAVQIKTDKQDWKDVVFIASKAYGGNSNGEMNYQYADVNLNKGISLYRLKQIDFTGKTSYSDMRSVRGEDQQFSTLSVFPNPAKNNFSILLPDQNALYDLQVIDATGRVVKQFTSIRNNKSISDLKSGQYILIAVNKESNTKLSGKVIIE